MLHFYSPYVQLNILNVPPRENCQQEMKFWSLKGDYSLLLMNMHETYRQGS